jgi:hypothetical protein
MKPSGESPSRSITTRFVGFPAGSAAEKLFATPTVARSSGIPCVRRSPASTGSITTTAPSSESAAVKSAQAPDTQRNRAGVLPPASRARAAARRSARPERSASIARPITETRKTTGGSASANALRATAREAAPTTIASPAQGPHGRDPAARSQGYEAERADCKNHAKNKHG